MQMRKVLLIQISSIGCCNPLVTMLNNGNFGFPYSLLSRFPPAFSEKSYA